MRSCLLSVFGIISEELLWIIMSPHSVSCIDNVSHIGEYSLAGFWCGICFGFLYVLIACIKFLYSGSDAAAYISFAVERSRVSCPEALMTLIFACCGWGLICIFVYLSCLLYTSPSPRDMRRSRMPSSA